MGLDPAVAATRLAVRRALADVGDPGGATVLVACSGGADSLALLAAAVFEAPRAAAGRSSASPSTTGCSEGSAESAARVVGPDGRARRRRDRLDPGHGRRATARASRPRRARPGTPSSRSSPSGSAPRSCSSGTRSTTRPRRCCWASPGGRAGARWPGMRRHVRGLPPPAARPDPRPDRAACRAQDIGWWTDPANEDPRFTRSRVRRDVLPLLETGWAGVAQNLARTADLLRADMEHLDDLADAAYAVLPDPLPVAALLARARRPQPRPAPGGAPGRRPRRRAVPRARPRPRRAAHRLARPGWRRPAGPGPRRTPGRELASLRTHRPVAGWPLDDQPGRAGPRQGAVHREADPGPPRRARP